VSTSLDTPTSKAQDQKTQVNTRTNKAEHEKQRQERTEASTVTTQRRMRQRCRRQPVTIQKGRCRRHATRMEGGGGTPKTQAGAWMRRRKEARKERRKEARHPTAPTWRMRGMRRILEDTAPRKYALTKHARLSQRQMRRRGARLARGSRLLPAPHWQTRVWWGCWIWWSRGVHAMKNHCP
jgi:hypothetical protein